MNKAKEILDKHSSKNDRVEFGEFGVMVKMPDAIRAIDEALQQVKNNDLLHSVSERNDVKRKLDEEFTHYEPTMCNGIATMRECENGTYIEREDAHLIIDRYVR